VWGGGTKRGCLGVPFFWGRLTGGQGVFFKGGYIFLPPPTLVFSSLLNSLGCAAVYLVLWMGLSVW